MQGDIRITGLTAVVNRVLDRLSRNPVGAEMDSIHSLIDTTARRVESVLRVEKLDDSSLTAATRAHRGWLNFFANREQFDGMVAAIGVGRPLLDAAAVGSRWARPIQLHFRPLRGLYQIKNLKQGAILSLPTASVSFDEGDFAALAQMVFHKSPAAKRHIIDRMQSEEYQSVMAELEVLGGLVDQAQGRHHDLADSFQRMNASYFANAMARPRLYWSRSLTRRKFGHYDWIGDAIMISRTLDAAEVPGFAVDFVMYHEMLHKHHGVRWTGGRRFAHTAEFRHDERKFSHFQPAKKVIEEMARWQRG